MDPEQTVKLCEQWFESDYQRIAEELKEHKELAFNFLKTVVDQNEKLIEEEYNSSIMKSSSVVGPGQKFTRLLLLLLEILCEKKFKSKIVDYVSRSYFPIEQSLVICQQKGSLEASAVLYRRKGQFKNSIDVYV